MTLPIWLSYSMITILASTPLYLSIYKAGGAQSETFERTYRSLMWIPGIIAFGFRIFTGKGLFDVGLLAGRMPLLFLVAVVGPFAMEFLLITLSTRLNLAQMDPSIIQIQGGKAQIDESVSLILGNRPQSIGKFLVNLFLTTTVGTVYMVIFSFIEEFGWRGFLQDQVIQTFGLSFGLVVVGLIWGLWHFPLVMMGYRFQEYPRLGAFLFMPVYTISLGMVIGWLYWLSGSIWVAALFNASIKVTTMISPVALGEAGNSRRVRIVWLWLWAVAGGLSLALWRGSLA